MDTIIAKTLIDLNVLIFKLSLLIIVTNVPRISSLIPMESVSKLSLLLIIVYIIHKVINALLVNMDMFYH
jgi:hypothetical protein